MSPVPSLLRRLAADRLPLGAGLTLLLAFALERLIGA
jgi:hypothetical protein